MGMLFKARGRLSPTIWVQEAQLSPHHQAANTLYLLSCLDGLHTTHLKLASNWGSS